MRELRFVRSGRLAWHERPTPEVREPSDALVRPFLAGRCDGDTLPLHRPMSRALQAGMALGLVDPVVGAICGKVPFRGPFAIGHECVAEIIALGPAVTGLRIGQRVVVPWAVSCGSCSSCRRGLTTRPPRDLRRRNVFLTPTPSHPNSTTTSSEPPHDRHHRAHRQRPAEPRTTPHPGRNAHRRRTGARGGHHEPAARPGFQVHFTEREPDMIAIGGRLLADVQPRPDVMLIDVAVMDGDWRQDVRAEVIERLLAAMARACGLAKPSPAWWVNFRVIDEGSWGSSGGVLSVLSLLGTGVFTEEKTRTIRAALNA